MIKEYIIELLQKNYDIEDGTDIDNLNFIEEGFVTSLGLIQFMIEIEEYFNIQFTDDEIVSENFRVVGKLAKMIEKKME